MRHVFYSEHYEDIVSVVWRNPKAIASTTAAATIIMIVLLAASLIITSAQQDQQQLSTSQPTAPSVTQNGTTAMTTLFESKGDALE